MVTLTPTGKFFFGGEMTFSTGRKKEDNKFSSYIIHSSMMPQQTSLLGMMRFLLLSNDETLFEREGNHIKADKMDDVGRLIGKQSFSVPKDCKEKGAFGKIDKLGSCFIYNKKDRISYFRAALDEGLQVDFSSCRKAILNGQEVDLPEIKKKNEENTRFSGKDFSDSFFISANKKTIKEKDLFIADSRIGIDKNYAGKTNNSAFYKQISYHLKDDFCFAFTVDVDEPVVLTSYNGQLVILGADSSSFIFEAYLMGEKEGIKIDYPQNADDEHRVTLISDAFLPQDIMESVKYAITKIRPFRFLKTKNETDAKEYNVKHRSFREPRRYDLYEAGSVFYFENKKQRDAFCLKLDCFEAFRQIGYNKYC